MPHVLHTEFCTTTALSEWIHMYETDCDLFSLSPLSSPDPTPPSSPLLSSAALPEDHTPRADYIAQMASPCFLSSSSTELSTMACSMATHPSVNSTTFPSAVASMPQKTKKPKSQQRRARQHAAAQAARLHRRTRDKATNATSSQPCDLSKQKYTDRAVEITASFNAATESRVASTGFIGINDRLKSSKVFGLSELGKMGIRIVEWDGRSPMFVSDSSGRVLVICAGHPDDAQWPILMDLAADAMEVARNRCSAASSNSHHRRGNFISLRCGVSYGGGQTAPSNLSNSTVNKIIVEWLNSLEPFQRLAGFTSSVFRTWAKELHDVYTQNSSKLHEDPLLTRIFPNGVFSAASYNLGPRTVCARHKDFANLPYGYCAVTALGTFDSTQGGHLILWELGIAIEFPAGSTILLPSALISHSNVSIAPHERRYSFTQYTAGGLFRWVAHGGKTKADYLASLPPEGLAQYAQEEAARWTEGLQKMPVISKG